MLMAEKKLRAENVNDLGISVKIMEKRMLKGLIMKNWRDISSFIAML